MTTVTGVDFGALVMLERRRAALRLLVLATGARHTYFGDERLGAVRPA